MSDSLVCLDCFRIFNKWSFTEKPSYRIDGCENFVYMCPGKHDRKPPGEDTFSYLYEIDDLMIPVIINLNKKGYKTFTCCSGHLHSQDETYVSFTNKNDKEMKEFYKSLWKLYPLKDFKLNTKYGIGIYSTNWVEEMTMKSNHIRLINNCLALLLWSESLPDRKDIEYNTPKRKK